MKNQLTTTVFLLAITLQGFGQVVQFPLVDPIKGTVTMTSVDVMTCKECQFSSERKWAAVLNQGQHWGSAHADTAILVQMSPVAERNAPICRLKTGTVYAANSAGVPQRMLDCGNLVLSAVMIPIAKSTAATAGGGDVNVNVTVIDSSVTNVIVDGGQGQQQPYYEQPVGGGGFNLSINSGYGAYAPAVAYYEAGLPMPSSLWAQLPVGPLPAFLPFGFGGYLQQQCPNCCSSDGGITNITNNNYYTNNVVNNPPPVVDNPDPIVPDGDAGNGDPHTGGGDGDTGNGLAEAGGWKKSKAQKDFDAYMALGNKKSVVTKGEDFNTTKSGVVKNPQASTFDVAKGQSASVRPAPVNNFGKVTAQTQPVRDGSDLVYQNQTKNLVQTGQNVRGYTQSHPQVSRPQPQTYVGSRQQSTPQPQGHGNVAWQNNRSVGGRPQQQMSRPQPTKQGGYARPQGTSGGRPGRLMAPSRGGMSSSFKGSVRPVSSGGFSKGGVSPVRSRR